MAAGGTRERHHEGRRGDRGDPEARGRRDHLRLSGQPHPRARGAGRHPADHRAPGADRGAHGRCHVAPFQRQEDRRVRDAARAGRRERVRRGRAGLWRGGADPGPADGLSAPDRARPAELQFGPQHAARDQVGRARDVRRRGAEHPQAGVHAPQDRAWRAGAGRGAGRRVRRGGGGAARLPARDPAPDRPRSRRRRRRRQAPRGRQAAGDLRRPGGALRPRLARAQAPRRAAGGAGHLEPRRQERLPREPQARARLRRQCDPGDRRPLPQERRSDLRHRLQLHQDQLRRRHAGRQGDRARDPRPDGPEQGRRRASWR